MGRSLPGKGKQKAQAWLGLRLGSPHCRASPEAKAIHLSPSQQITPVTTQGERPFRLNPGCVLSSSKSHRALAAHPRSRSSPCLPGSISRDLLLRQR